MKILCFVWAIWSLDWRSQFVISNSDKQGLRYVPFCFTEVGIVMLSAVLRNTTAVNVSIKITHAFVQMHKFLRDNVEVFVYPPRHPEFISGSPFMLIRFGL